LLLLLLCGIEGLNNLQLVLQLLALMLKQFELLVIKGLQRRL
jgi:hypothetical protein